MKYSKLQGYKYKLEEDYGIEVPVLSAYEIHHPYIELQYGIMVIKRGYCWDGATGVPDNRDNMRGSLVHDALYQLMRLGLIDRSYKDYADNLLRQICIQDGMDKFWADIFFDGVQAFGKDATMPGKNKRGQIIEI